MTPLENEIFDVFVRHAREGLRCPTYGQLSALLVQGGDIRKATEHLVRSGEIEIDVHAHNWRVVTIKAGVSAGLSTQRPAQPWAVYLRGDRSGYHYV